MPIVLKSGSLNLLETSGPVQACNRIALPSIVVERLVKEASGSIMVLTNKYISVGPLYFLANFGDAKALCQALY